MRVPAIAALGIAAYAAFLLATVPARFAAAHVEVPGLAIRDAQGTVWRGSARADIATGAGAVALERVRWRWRPARLAAGELAFAVEADAPGLHAALEAAWGPGGVRARAIRAEADAAALASVAPLLGAWRPEGRVRLEAPWAAWHDGAPSGEAHVEWRGAALALSNVRPLGDYRVDLHAAGRPATFEVRTLDGPLRVSGHGTVSAGGEARFTGEARAQPAAAQALAPLLDLLGPRRADGARALEWRQP